MALTIKQRVLLFSVVIAVMVSFLLFFYMAPIQIKVPKIQGITLKNSKILANFLLTDHLGHPVRRKYFLGQWHFIAYGYTHCPDICPTTLFTLSQVADLITTANHNHNTKFVFYSVDPNRDSQKVLAQYINYFSKQFVAVRADTTVDAEIFQQSLGIKVDIDINRAEGGEGVESVNGDSNSSNYQVSHGLAIYLINPDAELQAVFLPEVTELGMTAFDSEEIFKDYLRVIKYYQKRK